MLNILILDDCKVSHKDLTAALEAIDRDINIFPCFTYDDAINVIKSEKINVAFIDLQMPGQNGADLIVKLKGDVRYQDMKLVVLTATGEESLLKTSLQAMVDEYLHKGVSVEKIRKVLQRLTGEQLPVDLEQLKKSYGEELPAILSIYKEENDECFSEFLLAEEQQDLSTAATVIHKMKGSSRIIQHDQIVKLCEAIEDSIRQSKFSSEITGPFKDEYRKLSAYIARYAGNISE